MTYLTKKQQQELFIKEFLRRLRGAPPGKRVYMAVGELFTDAEVHELDEWRADRRAAAVRGDERDEQEDPSR